MVLKSNSHSVRGYHDELAPFVQYRNVLERNSYGKRVTILVLKIYIMVLEDTTISFRHESISRGVRG
jgi:hypothetical protein